MPDRPLSHQTNPSEDEGGDAKLPVPQLPGRLVHQPQEISLGHLESRFFFKTGPDRQLAVTQAARERFGMETIVACFSWLQHLARLHHGLDYLQVFKDADSPQELWFIEDAPGVVTALLPEDR